MKDITLRPYQQEVVSKINNLDPGAYLAVMATGLGKTATFSQIERRGRVLILSHRDELVRQPQQYYDCSFGIEQAGETSNGEEVVSASVQSLANRLNRFSPDDFDILITDECQHSVAPSYRKIYDYFKPRLHLGFTATPNRADHNFLGDIYSEVIVNRDLKWGIENKYLVDIECRKVNIGFDIRKVRQVMHDFQPGELEAAINKASFNEAIAEVYDKYAVGPTLIFAAGVDHAKSISECIPGSEVVTGNTPNRSEILERFRDGRLRCIVNCMVLTEGTDLPNTETIIMVRPTRNVSLYAQCVGRGTRLYPGKEKLHLIDCVGVSSLDICTAPVLFGISQGIAERTKQDQGMLSDMENRIEAVQNKLVFQKDFWQINSELVDIFQTNSGYNTHGVNYTMLGNGTLSCVAGKNKTLLVTVPDVLGKTSVSLVDDKKLIVLKDRIKMQDALDFAVEQLTEGYSDSRALWDKKIIQFWGNKPATDKQISYIKGLYTSDELADYGVDLSTITKQRASYLIEQRANSVSTIDQIF